MLSLRCTTFRYLFWYYCNYLTCISRLLLSLATSLRNCRRVRRGWWEWFAEVFLLICVGICTFLVLVVLVGMSLVCERGLRLRINFIDVGLWIALFAERLSWCKYSRALRSLRDVMGIWQSYSWYKLHYDYYYSYYYYCWWCYFNEWCICNSLLLFVCYCGNCYILNNYFSFWFLVS